MGKNTQQSGARDDPERSFGIRSVGILYDETVVASSPFDTRAYLGHSERA